MLGVALVLAAITSTAEINSLSRAEFSEHRLFAMTGSVTSVLYGNHYIFEDSTGRTHIRSHSDKRPKLGDRIAVFGDTSIDGFKQEQCDVRSMEILGPGDLPETQACSISDIAMGQCDFENIVVDGFVTDVIRDDIDSHWNYLILSAWGTFVYVTVPNTPGIDAVPEQFTRRYVRVTGTVIPNHCGARRFIGPHVETTGFKSLEILVDKGQGEIPRLDPVSHLQPTEVVRYGRRSLEGTVCCVWGESSLLLRDEDNEIHRVDLMDGERLPKVGGLIRVYGYPETDLYRINLSKARFDELPDRYKLIESPILFNESTAGALFSQLNQFHGHPVTFTGRVLAEPTVASGFRAIIEFRDLRLSYDVSAVPELISALMPGAMVKADGCGLIETENWRPGGPPPRQKDLVLVARSADDLTVLEGAPWWTPARVYITIIVLFFAMVGILIWNRILTHLVKRRERQLIREESAHVAAELRTSERTRLAVELHDSLSQTLTGIACQIESVDKARQKDPSKIERHLNLARSSLDSCREELKNCIWDLRNHTLEEKNAEAAIRKTLQPHAGSAEITVDVDILRSKLSDNTFHDILCILRELVANAVRHGKAKHIEITGTQSPVGIAFSVRDDGCGFDPDTRPGSAEGHFGLLGVTERLERLDGTLETDSAPGKGAAFHINIPFKK